MGTRQAHHSTDQADLGAGQVNRRQRARVWCLSRDRKEVAAVADGALQTRTATGPMLQTCRIAPESVPAIAPEPAPAIARPSISAAATGPEFRTVRIAPEPALEIAPPSTSAAAIVRRGPIGPASAVATVRPSTPAAAIVRRGPIGPA